MHLSRCTVKPQFFSEKRAFLPLHEPTFPEKFDDLPDSQKVSWGQVPCNVSSVSTKSLDFIFTLHGTCPHETSNITSNFHTP